MTVKLTTLGIALRIGLQGSAVRSLTDSERIAALVASLMRRSQPYRAANSSADMPFGGHDESEGGTVR